jgi:hypothetical protein
MLKTLDETEAVRLANEEHAGKRPATGLVGEKLPPVVSLLTPEDRSEASSPTITVRYTTRSQEPITEVKVLVDGRPVFVGSTGKDKRESGNLSVLDANRGLKGLNDRKDVKESGDLSVPIPPRDCEVSIIAENRNGASEPATVRLLWKGRAAKEEFQIKPKLYVLAVGVSE